MYSGLPGRRKRGMGLHSSDPELHMRASESKSSSRCISRLCRLTYAQRRAREGGRRAINVKLGNVRAGVPAREVHMRFKPPSAEKSSPVQHPIWRGGHRAQCSSKGDRRGMNKTPLWPRNWESQHERSIAYQAPIGAAYMWLAFSQSRRQPCDRTCPTLDTSGVPYTKDHTEAGVTLDTSKP